MTGSDRDEPLLRKLLYGFDLERLYLRLDLAESARGMMEEGLSVQRERSRRPAIADSSCSRPAGRARPFFINGPKAANGLP